MKRLIKYYNKFRYDDDTFVDCGTEYEILPTLVNDDADGRKLRLLGKLLNLKMKGNVKTHKLKQHDRTLKITHSIKLNNLISNRKDEEPKQEYLGFITLPDIPSLPPQFTPQKLTWDEMIDKVFGNYNTGIYDVCEIDNETRLILHNWSGYHVLPLLGYYKDMTDLLADHKIEDTVFDDSVFQCSDCGEYDWNDNGYKYNYRATDDGLFGLNCGCYDNYAKNNLDEYVNNHKQCIELDIAEELEKEGKLQFIERFIGGWTDGRGGYFNGEFTREGTPEDILKELRSKDKKGEYVFSHDESGQFQTYFSVWKVMKDEAKAS